MNLRDKLNRWGAMLHHGLSVDIDENLYVSATEVLREIERTIVDLDLEAMRDTDRSPPINWDCCCPDGGVHANCPIHRSHA